MQLVAALVAEGGVRDVLRLAQKVVTLLSFRQRRQINQIRLYKALAPAFFSAHLAFISSDKRLLAAALIGFRVGAFLAGDAAFFGADLPFCFAHRSFISVPIANLPLDINKIDTVRDAIQQLRVKESGIVVDRRFEPMHAVASQIKFHQHALPVAVHPIRLVTVHAASSSKSRNGSR